MLRRLLAASFAMATFAQAATVRVPADQPTIQAGINAASEGDTVLVAAGTYAGEGNRDLSFGGTNLVLVSESGARQTVIHCESLGRGFAFDHGESAASMVEGFSILRGTARYADGTGGGVYCSGASPTIRACIFAENELDKLGYIGGGGIVGFGSSSMLENCIIRDNDADSGYGGGVLWWSSNPTLENCIVASNHGTENGGMALFETSSATIVNTVFTGNTSSEAGSAIYIEPTSTAIIVNCIVFENRGTDIYDHQSNSASFYFSNVPSGHHGPGVIHENPRFISWHGFDYLLRPNSPCVDTGYPGLMDTVYESHPRWPENYANGARSDMGAYGGPGNINWLP